MFHLSISLWMVWSSMGIMHTTELLQLGKHLILELSAHVVMDYCWKTKAEDKMMRLFVAYITLFTKSGLLEVVVCNMGVLLAMARKSEAARIDHGARIDQTMH